jgi:hypothetical protein
MGCVLNSNKSLQTDVILEINTEEDLNSIDKNEFSLTQNFRKSYTFRVNAMIEDKIFRFIKNFLLEYYSNIRSKCTETDHYSISFNTKLPVSTDVNCRLIKEFLNFIHFTAKNCTRNFNFEFKYKHFLLLYKNIYHNGEPEKKENVPKLTHKDFRYSLFFITKFDIFFVKDYFLKYHMENFLIYNKNEFALEEITEMIISDVKLYTREFQGIIFPPIEFTKEEELSGFLYDVIQSPLLLYEIELNFIEIQIKVNINNYSILKNLLQTFIRYTGTIENVTLSLMFYNVKQENISKSDEYILGILNEFAKDYFTKKTIFILKLFFIIYERNCVEYKYYIFKEKEKKSSLIKRNSKQSQQSHSVERSSQQSEKPHFLNSNYLTNKFGKLKKLQNYKKILATLDAFLLPQFGVKANTASGSTENNSFVSNSNKSIYSLNFGIRDLIVDNQSRKFLLNSDNETNDSSNFVSFNTDYNEKFVEFYKLS